MIRFFKFFAFVALILFLVVFNLMAIHNFKVLSSDMIYGDGRAKEIFIGLRCGIFRIPDNELTVMHDGNGRIAGDFAQVYFPSVVQQDDFYSKQSGDPFQRQSRYAPMVHLIYKYTLCKLSYGWASWWHLVIQVLFFYISIGVALIVFKRKSYIPLALLFSNAIIFATPVGMSFIERGQFSLFVAMAYLWLLLGIYQKRHIFFVFAAICTFFKWTSIPFVFVVMLIWLISEIKQKNNLKPLLYLMATYVLTFLALLLMGFPYLTPFLKGLLDQESSFHATSLSLSLIMNRATAKLLPLVLIFIGYLFIKSNRSKSFLDHYLVWTAFGFILVTYPTKAFDYSTPCLLGFLPFFVAKQAEKIQFFFSLEDENSFFLHPFDLFLFFGLLFFLSVYDYLSHQLPLPDHTFQVWTYIICFALFCLRAIWWLNLDSKKG
ncbi:MAG: hypothetical protein RLY35_762 [Bacteroidota bacterium]|jgi:hypothetical protein